MFEMVLGRYKPRSSQLNVKQNYLNYYELDDVEQI